MEKNSPGGLHEAIKEVRFDDAELATPCPKDTLHTETYPKRWAAERDPRSVDEPVYRRG